MSATITASRMSRARRGTILDLVTHALTVRRQRQSLSRLDAHTLRDIGLSEAAARREANRPIWDVPVHWKR
ncbi:DUF1127 domain-containing protein [Rhodobacterales bacterium HKCCE3408]|nr:DUF1127 domain-containing protein [Rhodobacterales bacterium HKCCE3408]